MSRAPLHTLQAFVAVARSRNLTRAAAQLNLTVSALSHQMRALEQRLDQRLLVRGPRGVALTAHGERLLESVAAHVEGIERVFARARERNSDALSVSALPSFSSSWLMPRLPAMASRAISASRRRWVLRPESGAPSISIDMVPSRRILTMETRC